MKKQKIWIATGGTGGHIFPALSVADELIRRGHRVIISSDERGMKIVRNDRPMGAGVAFVWASGVGAKSLPKQILSLFKIGMSAIALTLRFLLFPPARVVAFGGYSSVPVIFAARLLKIPTFLHEQNAHIGRANKLALRWVDTLMTSFPVVEGIGNTNANIVYTGLPVRKEFLTENNYHTSAGEFHLLITGGSLGSEFIDNVIPDMIMKLPMTMRKKLFITQQTRRENVNRMQRFYATNGIKANVIAFINNFAESLSNTDLVIGRGGASTIAELQAIGRPAILVPLEINPDQAANAAQFAKTGGGIDIAQKKFTAKWLATTLTELFENPARLKKMAAAAKIPNNAVNKIVNKVLEV
ncbi:MAG: UDP-N-acetylglucosamine--N-acetylmuramyl-(pentapeptide) pyrophosphoryl-undecaprenol N-acetylglucosamine transferase [Rickettsiales bacterium]|nr:UDP-N-acetylglucosamine--N-acetylmuramyl-(pentapeptide) pyrophosphoryl-undecaprenol N-acetylglucosamine transferase [Rickettsiales bacterium]